MKNLIKKIEKDKIYFNDEIFYKIDNFMQKHPNYLTKISNGNNGYIFANNKNWGGKNYCFFLIDNFGNRVPISYLFSNKKNDEKEEVIKAFRNSIFSEISNFKKLFIENITKCEITGEVIGSIYNCHIDHHDHDFIKVVEMFMKKYNRNYKQLYKYVEKKDTKRHFNNKDLVNYFIEFHNANTTLRFTKSDANLKKIREK